MITTILLLAALTAGADTTAWQEINPDSLPGGYAQGWRAVPGIDPAVTSEPWDSVGSIRLGAAIPDSLCARCGKVCEVVDVQVRSPHDGVWLYPRWERRCPDHGRHVEWQGNLVTAKWGHRQHGIDDGFYSPALPDSVWDVTIADSVEIGLSENGTVVWRKVKP